MMTRRERLMATVAGEAVDRPAVALWRHFPGDDRRAEDLAAAHVWWQQMFDFDLVKVTPANGFCLEGWGVNTAWQGGDEGTSTYLNTVVDAPEDWAKLPVLDPTAGSLGEACRGVQLTCQALGPDVPVIMTVFSPLAQAKNLAGAALPVHMRHHPDALLTGLRTIAETTVRTVESLKSSGIAGIFYAAQMAEASKLSRAEYAQFGRPFDLQILRACDGLWFNMLHVHGLHAYLDLFADYPVQAVNWHDREGGPSLRAAAALLPGALSGGVDRRTVHRGTPDAVAAEAADAIDQTGGRRLILSTGCVVMTNSPLSNLRALRASVQRG